jgi:hypothetical protein
MRRVTLLSIILLGSGLTVASFSQSSSPLKGVWKVEERVVTGGPNAGKNSKPQPSLYIFAENYYSIMYVRGNKPRQLHAGFGLGYEATDAEKIESYGSFVANSGTYELSGSQLTTRPIVAKNPNYMAYQSRTFEYRLEGKKLLIIDRRTNAGEEVVTRIKLTRLE